MGTTECGDRRAAIRPPTYEPAPESDTDVYVDTNDDDDDGGERRFCRGKWWC